MTIPPDKLAKIKQLPPPHFGAVVPLVLLPAYLEFYKVQAMSGHRVTVYKEMIVMVKKVSNDNQ